MFKRFLSVIVFIVSFMFLFGSAQAALITYDYSGHIYQITGESISGISDDTTFSGTFTYEDTQPLTSDGNYFCDFTLDINGGIASEDDARININSSYSGYWDSMGIYAEGLSGDTDFTSSIDKVRIIFYYTDLFLMPAFQGLI